MRIKKPSKRQERYLPLADVKEIDDEYLSEMERVKMRLGRVKDEAIIKAFHDVLLSSYNAEIEIRTLEREVDYDIKRAQIKQRKRIETPWRRCWLWRLLFLPLTNRAQDIIEERSELNADIQHTKDEKAIEDDRKQFEEDNSERLSKRKLKRAMRDKLNAIIKEADSADGNAFDEPQDVPPVQANADTAAQAQEPAQEPPQMQMRLDELPLAQVHRARPPRSCRRPRT